jgi:hypothetical protein
MYHLIAYDFISSAGVESDGETQCEAGRILFEDSTLNKILSEAVECRVVRLTISNLASVANFIWRRTGFIYRAVSFSLKFCSANSRADKPNAQN